VRADQATDAVDSAVLNQISEISGKVDGVMTSTLTTAAEAARATQPAPDSDLRRKVLSGVHKLSTGLLERETEVCGAVWGWSRGALPVVRAMGAERVCPSASLAHR
jgi:hypothetical protein